MGFRHFFGVRATHVEVDDLWNSENENYTTSKSGSFKVRGLTTYTEFVGGDQFTPGEEIVFSFASCPIMENGRPYPYSRAVGNTIAKGRFIAGKTLSVTSQARSLDDSDLLPSALMIARVAQDHVKFADYHWFKGPLKVTLQVAVEGYAIRNRLEPVHEQLLISSFVCGDGSAYRDTMEQRAQRQLARESRINVNA